MSCVETAEPIEIRFWMKTQVGPRNHVLDRGVDPKGKGLSGPFRSNGNLCCSSRCNVDRCAFAAKGIIQLLSVTSCSRRGHSICQASTNSILKISGCRRYGLDAAYRPRRGWWDCTARAKSDIYDCLVRLCWHLH